MPYIYITIAFALGMIFILIINYVKKSAGDKSILKSNELAKKILDDSELEAENLKKTAVLEAKEEWYKTQKTYEDEINNRKKEIYVLEKEYNDRVSSLEKRLENLDRKENSLQEYEKRNKVKEAELKEKKIELDKLVEQQNSKLSEIARLSRDEAIQILKNNLKNKARNEAAKEIRKIADQTKNEANKIVAGILSTAIQRVAVDYVS